MIDVPVGGNDGGDGEGVGSIGMRLEDECEWGGGGGDCNGSNKMPSNGVGVSLMGMTVVMLG